VENEVKDRGEACEVVLMAGGDSNRLVHAGRNNKVGIGRESELHCVVMNSCSNVCLSSKVSASQICIVLSQPVITRTRPLGEYETLET